MRKALSVLRHLVLIVTPVLALQPVAPAAGQTAPPSSEAPAEALAPVPVDPLDSFCRQIGAPIAAETLPRLTGYALIARDEAYREVLGAFVNGRSRSVRYLADGGKSAQFVRIEGRELCLTVPGKTLDTCGVPLACASGEADLVMVDTSGRPFARLIKPRPPQPGVPEDADWVAFAGGTVALPNPTGAIASTAPSPAADATPRANCAVGAGYPNVDQAFAYVWEGGGCSGGFAQGDGRIYFLSEDGDLHRLLIGAGTGIALANGRLHWNFPPERVQLQVVCATADDQTIPTKPEMVARITANLTVPSGLRISDPFIHENVVEAANAYIERICGRGPVTSKGATIYPVRRVGAKEPELTLTWTAAGPEPLDANAAAALKASDAAQPTQEIKRLFAEYVRRLVETQRLAAVNALIESGDGAVNIADGLRSADVSTLVALTSGMTVMMRWNRSGPAYSDGAFHVEWRVKSSDPASAFFTGDRAKSRGWIDLMKSLPPGPAQVELNLACTLPASDAEQLPVEVWVPVSAQLTNYRNSTMSLQCSAP